MTFVTKLILFSVAWWIAIYIFHSLINGKAKRIQPGRMLLYISIVAMLGLYGEIFVDSLYKFIFGTPLWRYNIYPIHHAYTSAYGIVVWGSYGYYLYLLHDNFKEWFLHKQVKLALLFSVEALVLESLVEVSSRLTLGKYMYYYYPSGLWHISAFQNAPFYLICGVLIVVTIKRVSAHPVYFIFLSAWMVTMAVFFN